MLSDTDNDHQVYFKTFNQFITNYRKDPIKIVLGYNVSQNCETCDKIGRFFISVKAT